MSETYQRSVRCQRRVKGNDSNHLDCRLDIDKSHLINTCEIDTFDIDI